MPDAHTPEQRSHNMSRIRSTGTAPERKLGELLRLMFPDEELVEHPKDLPGKPDWWLPGLRLALFSDDCFFHKCPRHFIMPENNRAYWEPKLARNRVRDREASAALKALDITPIRIWEHDLRTDLTNARRKIRRAACEAASDPIHASNREEPH